MQASEMEMYIGKPYKQVEKEIESLGYMYGDRYAKNDGITIQHVFIKIANHEVSERISIYEVNGKVTDAHPHIFKSARVGNTQINEEMYAHVKEVAEGRIKDYISPRDIAWNLDDSMLRDHGFTRARTFSGLDGRSWLDVYLNSDVALRIENHISEEGTWQGEYVITKL